MRKRSGADPVNVAEILNIDRIVCGHRATSKKTALEQTAELLGSAHQAVPAHSIADGLFARERLGSTGLGAGVAIPHTRSGNAATGAFVSLCDAVDYDAPDGAPVDLIFGLTVPEESTDEHLQILAELAETLSVASLREKLRRSTNPQEVLNILTGTDG
ncbi:MAG: PTS system nitrogen regulatory IIA component [Gammaproteobacteria bacterium]|jgi:PTS system nitrogen regulatory IIA component